MLGEPEKLMVFVCASYAVIENIQAKESIIFFINYCFIFINNGSNLLVIC
jgi:hypothetical protein